MKYQGSKNTISKYILPIMLKYREDRTWVEPFVGGGNLIDKITGDRVGADINHHVIEALKAIRDNLGNLPKNNKEFSEKDYSLLRKNDKYPYKGYAGFAFSYAGKWMGGWCRDSLGKRDYVREAYSNALLQSPKLQGVSLIVSHFLDLKIPPNSLIYCDPPYQGTTKYSSSLNYDDFWQWCRVKTYEGHIVFISEYNAPSDFTCVWSKEVNSSLTQNTGGKKAVEKLFQFIL